MHLYKLIILLSGIIVFTSGYAPAQKLDSLLDDRQSKIDAYMQFKNNMKERTWINLVDLNDKACAVINADNELIWNHMGKDIGRIRDLDTQNEKLKLEMAYLKKEAESQSEQVNIQHHLNNVFLMIILGLSIAIILSIAFLIALIRRNKYAFRELERLWSMNDDQASLVKEKEKELNKQILLLEIEKKAMQKELTFLSEQKSVARKKLEEEINFRHKAEKEIKDLTGHIKKK